MIISILNVTAESYIT